MPEVTVSAPEVANAPTKSLSPDGRVLGYCAWASLFVFLAINVPLFLRMGLHADVTMWDLCARNVLSGGVHYRDAVENNLPGMLWLHLAVRSTIGWSSEALRWVDFGAVSLIAWLLMRFLPPRSSTFARAGTLFVLLAFYFATTEWCHCQRDTWMLLPSLGALHLRCRQTCRLTDSELSRNAILRWAFLEGLLWAAGFWIKPFIAVPCLACWLLSLWLTRGPGRMWRGILADGAGLLAGGLVAGGLGTAWLIFSGAWPYFVEVMLVWNREYAGFDAKEGLGWMYIAGFVVRLFPWVLIHVAAVPVALWQIWSARTGRTENGRAGSALLAGFYLAWLLQAVVLQHLFDYVHVPAILLGLTVVLARCAQAESILARFGLILFVAFGLILNYPAVYGRRLGVWERCLQEGSTAELRSRLALDPGENWNDLDQVRAYLEQQNVQDGELTCYGMRTTPLYLQLNIQPSTPYYFLQNALTIGASQRGRIHASLTASRQRFVVCDLFGLRLHPGELMVDDPETMPLPAMWQPPSRWADHVVFRSGRYVVFAIAAADMPDWLDDSFHL
jgi:hypothetical protein